MGVGNSSERGEKNSSCGGTIFLLGPLNTLPAKKEKPALMNGVARHQILNGFGERSGKAALHQREKGKGKMRSVTLRARFGGEQFRHCILTGWKGEFWLFYGERGKRITAITSWQFRNRKDINLTA